MDPDVRATGPGVCPRCRMKLVPGIAAPVEYPLRVTITPRAWRPGQKVAMKFEVRDPGGRRVTKLQVVHEKLFHLFIISDDLSYFAHEHPALQPDGTFLYEGAFPKAGMYRLAADFYPEGGTPQLAVKTACSAGYLPESGDTPQLNADLSPKDCKNLRVEMRTEPAVPVSGLKTMLFLRLSPSEGLELYLGAWGHMLVASADLVDLIHTHPFIADGGPEMQFNVVFPRPGCHRIWVQCQRRSVVNTAVFTVAARSLSELAASGAKTQGF
jgi:hypothetical protein